MNPSLWVITDNEKFYQTHMFDALMTKHHQTWPNTYKYILDMSDHEHDFTILETIANTNPNKNYIYNIHCDNQISKFAFFDLITKIIQQIIHGNSKKELCITWSGVMPQDVFILLLRLGVDYLILSSDLKKYLDMRNKWLAKTRIGCMFHEEKKEFGDFIVFNENQLDYLANEESG